AEVELVCASADDSSPTAVEQRDDAVRLFFASAAARDAAVTTLASRFRVEPIDVSDEDWARRSQGHLCPVTVGRITIFPNPESQVSNPESQIPNLALRQAQGTPSQPRGAGISMV